MLDLDEMDILPATGTAELPFRVSAARMIGTDEGTSIADNHLHDDANRVCFSSSPLPASDESGSVR